ncbi:MAG TPA: hypothetical protein VF844_04930, partial [Ktedonobacteraceae bacterium]
SWNRARFGPPKTHALDALCVGDLAGVDAGSVRTLHISASGRGQYCRTLFTRHGFPRGYLMRQKQVNGFQTGDLVLAVVPPPYQAQGTHKGRVAVRKSTYFRIGGVDSVPARCCTVLQRGDGYEYAVVHVDGPPPIKEHCFLPCKSVRGIPGGESYETTDTTV